MSVPEPEQSKLPDGIFVLGFPGEYKKYPAWRYHEWLEPVVVENTEEDERSKLQGWVEHNKPVTAVRHLLNQRFDLEDMTPRQLVQYARDEFGVDLPVEIGRVRLFKAIWRLSANAPENEDRVVLMAHALQMNLDETEREIRRAVEDGNAEVTIEEFYA